MAIMASYCFFIHLDVMNSNQKSIGWTFLIFNFDLGPQKVYMNVVDRNQICKGLSKGFI
jgi:hypothetical protein